MTTCNRCNGTPSPACDHGPCEPGQPHWTEEPKPGVAASNLFRKKPIVISAVQYTRAICDAYLFDNEPLPAGVRMGATNIHPGRREVYRADAYINTLEGRMGVSLGDWIITGVKGEHYACKPDIFAMTYEVARAAVDTVEALKPLTSKQIEEGWKDTFNTNDPFCPCDLKSFSKAVNWVERQRTITLARTKALGSKATEGQS